jgi:hypothetical protein
MTLTVVIAAMLASPFASAAFAKGKTGPVDNSPVVTVCPDHHMICVKVNGKMIMPKDHECESMDIAV